MICNYAEETTIYASDHRKEEIIKKSESDTTIRSIWFRDNSMKVNGGKYHLIFFSNVKSTTFTIKVKK